MLKLTCSLQLCIFIYAKKTLHLKKQRGIGAMKESLCLLPSQPALAQKRCPSRFRCPQTKRLPGSFSAPGPQRALPSRCEARRERPVPLQASPLAVPTPAGAVPTGRTAAPRTDGGRDRRVASCLPRVTQPRPGWRWQPPVPPGLNPRCATAPAGTISGDDVASARHPHPGAPRAELPPQRYPPPRGPAGAAPGHGPCRARRPLPPPRQELFQSAPALPRRGGGPDPRTHTPRPRGRSRPQRWRRRRPRSRRAHLRPRCPGPERPLAHLQPRGSPHTPEPPGPGRGCAAGAAGSSSPATAFCRGPPRLREPRAPTCSARAGGSARAAAQAQGSLKQFPLVFLGRGGRCPEPLQRRGTARTERHGHGPGHGHGHGIAPAAGPCAPSCSRRPAAAPGSPRRSSRAQTGSAPARSRRLGQPPPRPPYLAVSRLLPPLRPAGQPRPVSPSAPLPAHLAGPGRRSPAGMSPGPGRPSIAAQEILDLVCHGIALVFSVAALTRELEVALSVSH